MKVLKFGGTSVGSAEMMKKVARLVNDDRLKIVVLSAMAGSTNKLFEIAENLYQNNNDKSAALIEHLEDQYYKVVEDLFTAHEERAVLAQGELISSSLFQFYLEEQKINSVLLPALNFMRIDTNSEPDNYYIKENLMRELDLNKDAKLFITQGYICRNLYGEIDNLKRGGSDY